MKALMMVAIAVVLACGSRGAGGGGDCERIVDHAIAIGIREQSAGMSDAQRERLAAEVKGRRAKAIDECKHRKPSKRNERCALEATTLAQMNACQ